MELGAIEKRFVTYLATSWALGDIEPFLQTYIGLLFLFSDEIPQKALAALQERQKQLRGEEFQEQALNELRDSSRRELDRNLRNNSGATRDATLNRMLFCALLDTEEPDFFYLTEPMFEFVQKMKVSPDQLEQILESEFPGFRVES